MDHLNDLSIHAESNGEERTLVVFAEFCKPVKLKPSHVVYFAVADYPEFDADGVIPPLPAIKVNKIGLI